MLPGGRIKAARKRARLSQGNLAEMLSIHEATLRRWEMDEFQPRASDLKKLAEALGVTEAELLNGPQDEGYTVTLNFVEKIEEVHEEMMLNGKGAVTLADDGTVLASHLGKMFNREDKDTILAAIGEKLDEAWETIERRTAKKKAAN